MNKKRICLMASFMGFLFLTAYIRSATCDVVYTDYIRIIGSYLENVFSIKPYLHGDILTRIPVNYFERIINVVFFGYSTTFDMILGALGLAAAAAVVLKYAAEKKLPASVLLLLFLILFALDKWEMLTNGTGWVHFWAFFCFYLHYCIYDKVRNKESGKKEERLLCIFPSITILLIAGPYCAIYAGTMLILYAADLIEECRSHDRAALSRTIRRTVCLMVPFLLFVLSRALSVEEYAGATELSLSEVMRQAPLLIPDMALKSFASMVIGGETAMQLQLPGAVLDILGILVIAAYVYALVLNFTSGLYKKTAFPLMLILSGLVSHGIVIISRWIFLDDMYLMSSRYALQFQSGILGIVMTFSMIFMEQKADPCGRRKGLQALLILFFLLIAAGRLVTTGREIKTAPYRQEAFAHMQQVALNYEDESDETLKTVLQYHAPEKTREALKLLENKKLNIFREE